MRTFRQAQMLGKIKVMAASYITDNLNSDSQSKSLKSAYLIWCRIWVNDFAVCGGFTWNFSKKGAL